jgi:hypothetical protein
MTTVLERQRIQTARRAALRNRLISEGLLPDQVDHWIEVWLAEGGDPDTSAFWARGHGWVIERARRRWK